MLLTKSLLLQGSLEECLLLSLIRCFALNNLQMTVEIDEK